MNEYYRHAKFDIYHIHSVRENRNDKVSATYGHWAGEAYTDHYKDSTFSCKSKIIIIIIIIIINPLTARVVGAPLHR